VNYRLLTEQLAPDHPESSSARDQSGGYVSVVLFGILLGAVMFRYGAFGERWRTAARRAVVPALIVGGIGFAAGFFGPMVFRPDANQGPLLGIFITGPIGFLAGLAYGVIRELARKGSDEAQWRAS
jgi:hypothetical protein